MSIINVHIINHTHWDREWFLTSIYTSQWIPGLIDKLEQIVGNNPNFRFFLDGQTLIIEDLLQIAPDYEEAVSSLITKGNLVIGPYYSQPDWRLTSGEALIRNLLLGHKDLSRWGSKNHTGWLVDTFGHVSQAPQIHRLFGVRSVYVWRGVPTLEPYFHWIGANGDQIFSINLFGGYRNLYGITHIPELAIPRLKAEVNKLVPFYPTADIPLFDGYDLEDNPEDPLDFYQRHPSDEIAVINLRESSPQEFANQIQQKLDHEPALQGELNSGKYAATFPGTLSTRTYLKVMSQDCEHKLYQVCEPLGVLAHLKGRPYPAVHYETWSRTLLQNAVHDCICGVSIDQVHEKMEYSYRKLFHEIQADIQVSLAYILRDFAPGTYAISTNPSTYHNDLLAQDQLYTIQTDGIGVWHIGESIPVHHAHKPVEGFTWQNIYYTAELQKDGTLKVGKTNLGKLAIYHEEGDAYSEQKGELIEICLPQKPMILEQESTRHNVLRIEYTACVRDIRLSAEVRITFDQSPLIQWQIDLDTRGSGFRVELLFEARGTDQVFAGMPFDVVQRSHTNRDLLPRQLDSTLEGVLMGQRELGLVETFPFQEFVVLTDGITSTTIMAKGLHSYQANDSGLCAITLRRSIEWLTRRDLENRVGDAGPFFYVPDARCERTVTHHLATMVTNIPVNELYIFNLIAGFQNPPLLVQSKGKGELTQWQLLQENLPLSSLHFNNDQISARFFNPTTDAIPLTKAYLKTDVMGNPEGWVNEIPAKNIFNLMIDAALLPAQDTPHQPIILLNPPTWQVGPNRGLPDPQIIQQMKVRIHEMQGQIAELCGKLDQATGRERYILEHQIYVLKREAVEYQLSVRLNEEKLARQGQLNFETLYKINQEIAEIGLELNRLRIKRRIYDYIAQMVS